MNTIDAAQVVKKQFVEKLMDRINVSNVAQLARRIGYAQPSLSKMKRGSQGLSVAKILNMVHNAYMQAPAFAIEPIVEYRPIKKSGKGQPYVLDAKGGPKKDREAVAALKGAVGIYVFYNASGEALYVGKTAKMDLWTRLNQSYRNDTDARGKMKLASEGKKVNPKKELTLLDLAAYFSAYKVAPSFVHNAEAFLIRVFANTLKNAKGANFKFPK